MAIFDPATGMFYDENGPRPDPDSPAKGWTKAIEAGALRPIGEMGQPFSAIVGTKYLGVTRRYSEPLTRVGPVRSGSLREFEEPER